MTEHVTQPINNADSDIQEIDQPILLCSMRKRHRRRILSPLIAASVVVAQETKKKQMKEMVLLQVIFVQCSHQFR
jgi:hypothetical protein